MTHDADIEWIGYHTSILVVIHMVEVVTTPYYIDVENIEWYYHVSPPWLVSPRQDDPREVSVLVYDAGPSGSS